LPPDKKNNISDIDNLPIKTLLGTTVRLKDVGQVVQAYSPPTIKRKEQERVIGVLSDVTGRSLGEVAADIKNFASKIEERISMEFPSNLRHNLDIISHIEPTRFSNAKIHSHIFRQSSPDLYNRISKIIQDSPNVRGLEHLEIMEEGNELSLSFTAFFDHSLNIATVHHSTEDIEAEIRRNLPNLKRCVIHTAPIQKQIK
jgi:hypothetical protein